MRICVDLSVSVVPIIEHEWKRILTKDAKGEVFGLENKKAPWELGAFKKNGGMDGTRTRDLYFRSPCKQEGGGEKSEGGTHRWIHEIGPEMRGLAKLIEVWDSLPSQIQKAILAIIESYEPGDKQ